MKKIIKNIVIAFISLVPIISFGNYLKFTPSGNTNWNGTIFTGQYHCSTGLTVVAVHEGTHFSSCEFYVRYTTGVLSWDSWGWFQDKRTGGLVEGYSWLYKVASQSTPKQGDAKTTQICANFNLIQDNLTGVVLKFVANDGVTQTSTASNGLKLAAGGDTSLSSVRDLTVNYEACPCDLDNESPVWNEESWGGEKNGSRVVGNLTLTGIINDKQTSANKKWNYWFSGNNYSLTGLNYQPIPSNLVNKMDNQVGVNSGRIKIYVNNVEQTNGLSILDYDQSSTYSNITWNSNRRGYKIAFTNGVAFEREKPVTIKIDAYDNGLNYGTNCKMQSAGGKGGTIRTYQFNTGSHNPTIRITKIGSKEISESDWAAGIREINPDDSITFEVEDDWSGINTGTLKISFPEIKIISGDEEMLLFTGVEYSWTDFTGYNELVGVDSFHGSGVKKFTIDLVNHPDWPTNTGINVTGEVYDYENNKGTLGKIFNTRKDCSEYYGCYNPLKLNFMSGGVLITDYRYKSGVIIVTGTVAPYPYLTGEDMDILMCGPVDTSVVLTTTGGLIIKDEDDNLINSFDGTGLYLTGEDLLIQLVDGKIVVTSSD